MELHYFKHPGILTAVANSQWTTLTMLVHKPDGFLCTHGDFKNTINIQSIGGKIFVKIDLKDAGLQLPLDASSGDSLVMNTSFALFHYYHLPFGITSTSVILKRYMEHVSKGMSDVASYLDDIIVADQSAQHLMDNLDTLFSILQTANICCNSEKCQFFIPKLNI
ncbi:uncharacterized protein K02A2.6-like [Schistocerca piceifrons]|uniref:uncharacterized protein K02A2.6-like n=1 Tax=Schistocerca piceifrons TaxID=274613 RepID=UPI001F5FE0A6|nr:uncharacterized protein K02A2.6-like [Schistocerca piceifrons]